MEKKKDKFQTKIINKLGNMKDYKKALLKSLLTLYGSVASIIVSIFYFISGDIIRGIIFSISFVGLFLMCLSFSSQYKTFKFLAQFAGNYDEKKD
jgi:hypothetical protein